MKQLRYVLLVLAACVLLSACASNVVPTETVVSETKHSSEATEVLTEPIPETTATTQPVHSAFYLPDVPVEDVIRYFNEVCLDAEIINGGDPTRLQKWMTPISYAIHGECTNKDMEVFTQFVDWLNQVDGFPGIYPAEDAQSANMNIHFCKEQEMLSIMGDNFYNMDGAVTFWYDDDAIFKAVICYRTDIFQRVRNSVILEEIYNGLGPIQDTDLREDSIIYSSYSTPQALTQMDAIILRLLYHPSMECGMNTQQCEEVIRSLYY